MAQPEARITCPTCGRKYRWTAQVAGRRVKCHCGQVMVMPDLAAAEAAGLTVEPAPVSHAPPLPSAASAKPPANANPAEAAAQCPACRAALSPQAVLCVACGFNLKSGQQLRTSVTGQAIPPADAAATPLRAGASIVEKIALKKLQARQRALELTDQESRSKGRMQEVVWPVTAAVGGLFLILLHVFVLAPWANPGAPYPNVVRFVGLQHAVTLVIQVPLLLFGIYLTSLIFGTGYGSLFTGLLKLVAIALAVAGVSSVVVTLVLMTLGGLIFFFLPWVMTLGTFWALCAVMLDMDFMETLVLYLLTYGLGWLVATGAFIMILMIFG